MDASERAKFEWLVQQIDAGYTLVRARDLHGGVSAQVTALEVLRPDGRAEKMIARIHGEADLARNPHIAADEFKLLRALHAAGLPVPEPYYVDSNADIFPAPCLVVEYIEGDVKLAPEDIGPYIRQMAAHLARIHSLDLSRLDLPALPRHDESCAATLAQRPAVPDESLSEGRIREILEAAWPLSPLNPPVLLHGDYWPGNLLWQDGQLAGIVDWEDAALGDPLADLANSRLEALWALGPGAMRRFTDDYTALMPALDYSNLPFWDLFAALRPAGKLSTWGLDERTEQITRERHREFVDEALAGATSY